jgi:hypothetical protein
LKAGNELERAYEKREEFFGGEHPERAGVVEPGFCEVV